MDIRNRDRGIDYADKDSRRISRCGDVFGIIDEFGNTADRQIM
jgi:hypothetical protein